MRNTEQAFRAEACRVRADETHSPFLRQALVRLARGYDCDEWLFNMSVIAIAETRMALRGADLALRGNHRSKVSP
jgi:hypothetical protein